MLKKVLFLTVVVLSIASIASSSTTRLQSLLVGGFIEDDSDMFTNPALVALYPNLVIGELGVYDRYEYGKNGYYPDDQWAGVTFGSGAWAGGLIFNRDIPMVDYIGSYDYERYYDMGSPFYNAQRPVNPVEVMAAWKNDGFAVGGRVYLVGAGCSEEWTYDGDVTRTDDEESSIKDFAGGFVADLGNGNTVEGYANVGLFSFSAEQRYPEDTLSTEYHYRSDGGKYMEFGLRSFYSWTKRTRIVPLIQFFNSSFTYTEDVEPYDTTYTWEVDESEMFFGGGVGVNTRLSRHSTLVVGARFGYGTWKQEHNDWMNEESYLLLPQLVAGLETDITNWFTARMGVQKCHLKVTDTQTSEGGGAKQDYGYTDTYTDSEYPGDFMSLGCGIHLGQFLFDATLMEDIPFTGTYLLSGISGNLHGKITATYSF